MSKNGSENHDDVSTWKDKGDEAIKYYDKAIETDPNYVDVWNNKVKSLGNLGKYDEAIHVANAIEDDSIRSQAIIRLLLLLQTTLDLRSFNERTKLINRQFKISQARN